MAGVEKSRSHMQFLSRAALFAFVIAPVAAFQAPAMRLVHSCYSMPPPSPYRKPRVGSFVALNVGSTLLASSSTLSYVRSLTMEPGWTRPRRFQARSQQLSMAAASGPGGGGGRGEVGGRRGAVARAAPVAPSDVAAFKELLDKLGTAAPEEFPSLLTGKLDLLLSKDIAGL